MSWNKGCSELKDLVKNSDQWNGRNLYPFFNDFDTQTLGVKYAAEAADAHLTAVLVGSDRSDGTITDEMPVGSSSSSASQEAAAELHAKEVEESFNKTDYNLIDDGFNSWKPPSQAWFLTQRGQPGSRRLPTSCEDFSRGNEILNDNRYSTLEYKKTCCDVNPVGGDPLCFHWKHAHASYLTCCKPYAPQLSVRLPDTLVSGKATLGNVNGCFKLSEDHEVSCIVGERNTAYTYKTSIFDGTPVEVMEKRQIREGQNLERTYIHGYE